MNTFPVLLGALCVYALAYRYYSAFIAAKALALDDRRTTPAHTYADGHNYVASPQWVLFGHHFAAIAGAGPLVGPTLAAQFGFAPGFLWLLIGAVLAGCVQDFTVLVASIRHRGRSLADIARTEISPFAGLVAMIAVLFILLVTLAGLGIVVVNALSNSPWGVFTIGMTIPIAVIMGLWMFKSHAGKITVTGPSIFGVVLLAQQRGRRTLGGAERICIGAYFHASPDHHPHGHLRFGGFGTSRLVGAGTARLPLDLCQAGHDHRAGHRRLHCSSQHSISELHAIRARRRADHQRNAVPIPLRDHRLRCHLGLSLAGFVRHHAQDAG